MFEIIGSYMVYPLIIGQFITDSNLHNFCRVDITLKHENNVSISWCWNRIFWFRATVANEFYLYGVLYKAILTANFKRNNKFSNTQHMQNQNWSTR